MLRSIGKQSGESVESVRYRYPQLDTTTNTTYKWTQLPHKLRLGDALRMGENTSVSAPLTPLLLLYTDKPCVHNSTEYCI